MLHREAPCPSFSLLALLGTAGGIGLVVGPAGLLWLSLARDPAPSAALPKHSIEKRQPNPVQAAGD